MPRGGTGRSVRVVVADDQTVVREGLVMLLELMPDIDVVGAAADGEQALELVAADRPDVVLMDLWMPRMDGVAATARVRRDFPDTQVVVLTTYADDESVFAALRAGARSYLTKDARAEEISEAVSAVHSGEVRLDGVVQRRLVEGLAAGDGTGGREVAPPRGGDDLPDGMTPREREVLRLIAEGRSNSEIARELYVAEATVKTHINNLFAKAGLRDRAQAVTYAVRHGLARP